jgi:hypothetical protein
MTSSWRKSFSLLGSAAVLFFASLARPIVEAERPALTTNTCHPRSDSVNKHVQDIGLGLRNIAIIRGEFAA